MENSIEEDIKVLDELGGIKNGKWGYMGDCKICIKCSKYHINTSAWNILHKFQTIS